MKENKVFSDFILFNDILDEIATKEKEEEEFFDTSGLMQKNENLDHNTDIGKDGEDEKSSVSVHSTQSIPADNNQPISDSNPSKESLHDIMTSDHNSKNVDSFRQDVFLVHSREGSFSSGYENDEKYAPENSDSDLNSDQMLRRISKSSRSSSEKNFHKINKESSSSTNISDCHNSETEEDKKIQFMLRYSNFCEFLEEVKKKVINQPEEKFKIEIKNKLSYKTNKNLKNQKPEKMKSKRSSKNRMNVKSIPSRSFPKSALEDTYVDIKLGGIFKDKFLYNSNNDKFASHNRSQKKPQSKISLKLHCDLNQEKKLDSRLKDTDNPVILSWLSEKERKEKEMKRDEFRQRRLRKKEQRQKQLEQEKFSQLSSEKVQSWVEQKRQDNREKVKHLYPAFEEERKKLLRVEKELNKKQLGLQLDNQEKKWVRFSTAKHKSSVLQVNGTTNTVYYLDRPGNPVGFLSVEAFTHAIINEAINELDMASRVKSARLGRCKTGFVDRKHYISERIPSAPTASKKSPTKLGNVNHIFTRPVWRITTPGFSRTFDEWLAAKKGLDRVKARERITNHYYDELEKEIIKKEHERQAIERLSSRKRVQSAFNPYIISSRSSTEYMNIAL